MNTIVHRIRLRHGVDPGLFESWVRSVDYAACPRLPSIVSFGVHRVAAAPDAPVHFFEVIGITSHEAFRRDMATEEFGQLASDFAAMATVVDELSGELVEPGYQVAN